jgi:hypothetical protein
MTLSPDDKKDLAVIRLEKAEVFLKDAATLLPNEMGEIFRNLQARRVDSDGGNAGFIGQSRKVRFRSETCLPLLPGII